MPRFHAWKDFTQDIGAATSLLQLERVRFADPPPPADMPTVSALRNATAVLTVSALEAFVRDLLTQAVDQVSRSGIVYSLLPVRVRRFNAENLLSRAMKPAYVFPRPSPEQVLQSVQLAAANVAQSRLRGEAFGHVDGNPSSEALADVFRQFDMDDLFRRCERSFQKRWPAPASDTFIKEKLDDIVRRRNRVAHGARGLSISRKDLSDGIQFVEAFASALEQMTRIHARKVAARAR